jgi:hypothetical protein
MILMILLTNCGRFGRPTTPPTFVWAWRAGSRVWTAESSDGIIWRNERSHQGSETNGGPAIAHDGNLFWMLLWANPRGLDYTVGIGGLQLSGAGGVSWQSQVVSGKLPAQAAWPSLAYGNSRWVTVFHSTNDRLQVVRSMPNSATEWEAVADVLHPSPGGPRPATSPRGPALAFGNNTFVLLRYNGGTVIASTSPDGLVWTERGSIGLSTERDPALAFSEGYFYGTTYKVINPSGVPRPALVEIHKSADGVNWTKIGEGGHLQDSDFLGVGLSYGLCKMGVLNDLW